MNQMGWALLALMILTAMLASTTCSMKKITQDKSRFAPTRVVDNRKIKTPDEPRNRVMQRKPLKIVEKKPDRRIQTSEKEEKILDPGKISSAMREAFLLKEMQEGDKSLIFRDYGSALDNLEKALQRRPDNPYIKKMISYTQLKKEEEESFEIKQLSELDSLYASDRYHDVISKAESIINEHQSNRYVQKKVYEYLYQSNLFSDNEKALEYHSKMKSVSEEIAEIEDTRNF